MRPEGLRKVLCFMRACRARWLAMAVAVTAGTMSGCGSSGDLSQPPTVDAAGAADASHDPAAAQYIVAPMRISPDHGTLIKDNPYFREPQFLWTDHGLITVFMEIPADDTAHRGGMGCRSDSGLQWSCAPIDRGAGGTDFADARLTDSRGDPCPTYGNGITLAALRASPAATLEPIAYYSPDFGKTWVGPEVLPYPNGIEIPLADGSKDLFTGRDYIAWRDFTFLTGEYISQLQTDSAGKCSWAVPVRLTTFVGASNALGYDDGSDHPRLAATPVPGELAARGSFDDNVLTFHRFGIDQVQQYQSIIGPTSPAEDATIICPAGIGTNCDYELDELGTTLLWVPSSRTYIAVYSQIDTGAPTAAIGSQVGLWYKTSIDEGHTWSPGIQLAGPSVDGSFVVMEETLAYDEVTGDVVLGYYEVPKQSSYDAKLQMQVLHAGAAAWTAPQTVRALNWQSHGAEKRFGDYFGLQTHDGVAHIVEGNYDDQKQTGYIEYFSLRYPK